MTGREKADLLTVIEMLGVIDERLRNVEIDVNTLKTTEVMRKEHKVGLRWGVSTVISISGVAAAVAGTVVAILLRVIH